MIAYTMVGTNDLPRAGAFYDALFGPLGYKRLSEDGDRIAWGIDFAHPVFFATKPFDGEPAARQQVSAALFFDSHLFPTLVFTPSSDRGSRRMGHKLRAYRAGIFLVLLVSSLASVRLVDAENWSGQRGAIPIYRRGSGKVPEFREPARR